MRRPPNLDVEALLAAKLRARAAQVAIQQPPTAELVGPAFFPNPAPVGWRVRDETEDGRAYQHRGRAMIVICSTALELDGNVWAHISCSKNGGAQLPSYAELAEVKATFLGAHRKAVLVFAPTREHVNLHPNVHHLWTCLTGEPLPDFTHGTGSI